MKQMIQVVKIQSVIHQILAFVIVMLMLVVDI